MVLLANMICQQIKRKRGEILAFSLAIFFAFPKIAFSSEPKVKDKVDVVVIDPGHGGFDPGAVGSIIKEKEVVLQIALKLGKYIEENFEDVKVIYTRDSDEFIELHERARIAIDAEADLFISIHANAVSNSRAVGTETFVIGRHKDDENFEIAKKENSVILLEDNYETKYQGFDPNSIDSYIIFSVMQKTFHEQSIAMASFVQDEFEFRAKRKNRGVKQAGFVVLWRTTMPSVLIETGFLTHPEEEKFLASTQGQDYIASAIYRAFRTYKTTIEGNSRFEVAANNVIDNSVVDAASVTEDSLYYKVQVLVTRTKLDNPSGKFDKYNYVEEFESGRWFKYAVGKETEYDAIQEYCKTVQKDYPDAFVIAIKNGEITSLKKASKGNL